MTNYFDASVELVVANHWNIQLRNGTPAGSIAKVRVSRNWTLTHFPHKCKKYPQIWHGLADMCVDMSITLQPLVSSDPLQPRYSWSRYLYINQWHIGVYRCLLNLFGVRRKVTCCHPRNRPEVLPATFNIILPLDDLSWLGTLTTTFLLSIVMGLLAYVFSSKEKYVCILLLSYWNVV